MCFFLFLLFVVFIDACDVVRLGIGKRFKKNEKKGRSFAGGIMLEESESGVCLGAHVLGYVPMCSVCRSVCDYI